MTHGREKRLLMGLLAFLAPIPLPFNGIVSWPATALYLAAVALAVRQALADRGGWLSGRTLNILGAVYLPIFLLDLTSFSSGGLVTPVVHLGLFTVAVRLFALGRERDKWQAMMGIFFLFLASMATSVHLTVTLYLLAFVTVSLLVLARFAYLHLLATFGKRQDGVPAVPMAGFLGLSLLLGVLIAVPLFAILPRVTSPYIRAPIGRGGISSGAQVGFSDEVTLDSIGRIRQNREVALRFETVGARPGATERYLGIRFKGGTFDRYGDRRWRRTERWRTVQRQRGSGDFLLRNRPVREELEIYLEPLGSNNLPLPVHTTRFSLRARRVQTSAGGVVRMFRPPGQAFNYRVGLAAEPVLAGRNPRPDDGTLDTNGVTPAMAELARNVLGDPGDPAGVRTRRLLDYLQGYEYTLDMLGSDDGEPLEAFLLEDRRGHCELFASSMVLLLRSEGIPARLATGFLGAEYNTIQGYFVVRQGNAHAWVEAYLPDEGGWTTFDPTPPAGRPLGGRTGFLDLASQAYDSLVFRWDRYVLSYGTQDQFQLFLLLRRGWIAMAGLFSGFGDDSPGATADGTPAAEDDPATEGAEEAPVEASPWPLALGFGVALLVVAGLWWWRRRAPLTATVAFGRLRRELERDDGQPDRVAPADPPLAVRRVLLRRVGPDGAAPAERVVGLYLSESFGGRELSADERQELEGSLKETLRGLRKAG